ncbi:MAG: hypothetical protein ACO2PM_25380 [Pyrobaculum sp.]
MEVLYHVDVIAIAGWGTARVRLAPGEDRTVTVAVPGTIGIDERRLRPAAAAFVALEESKPPLGGRPQDFRQVRSQIPVSTFLNPATTL